MIVNPGTTVVARNPTTVALPEDGLKAVTATGWLDKAADTVASWFGDQEAERRRREDVRRDHRGRGPKGYRRSDERIEEDVNQRLTDDYVIDASEIEVTVNGAEVTLTGTVNNRNDKRRAEDIAESVSGVTNVENRLRVRKGDGSSTYRQLDSTGTTGTSTSSAAAGGTGTGGGSTGYGSTGTSGKGASGYSGAGTSGSSGTSASGTSGTGGTGTTGTSGTSGTDTSGGSSMGTTGGSSMSTSGSTGDTGTSGALAT